MATFCAFSNDQITKFLKVTYSLLKDGLTDLNSLSNHLYSKIYGTTKNEAEALTYVSLLPKIIMSLNLHRKEVRDLLKGKMSLDKLNEKIDEWQSIANVQK